MIRVALLVAGKDLRVERRSRVLLWQVVPFGVMALLLCGLALGPNQAGHSSAAPGLFYLVIVLVALLMINRSHAIEATPAAPGRRSRPSGLDPAGVFLGKAAALAVELWLTRDCPARGQCPGAAHGPPRDPRGDCPSILVTLGRHRGRGNALRGPHERRERRGDAAAGPQPAGLRAAC